MGTTMSKPGLHRRSGVWGVDGYEKAGADIGVDGHQVCTSAWRMVVVQDVIHLERCALFHAFHQEGGQHAVTLS